MYLQQNHISSIQETCDVVITGSDLDAVGCDALLCAPGTYNDLGRSTSQDDPCLRCGVSEGTPYFGSVACGETAVLTEEDAIKLIYSSCNGLQWVSRTSWLSDTIPFCQWEGITCSQDGSVTGISLRSNGLTCAFPVKDVLKALSSLATLVLEGNEIGFDFAAIEGSPSITALDITNTNTHNLEGIETLNKLVELHASSNSISGTFPKKVLQLSYLEILDLSFNNLGGALPIDIGFGLKRMHFLSLSHNRLTGGMPSSLGQMSALKNLQLQSNKFTGQIPQEVLDLTELQTVDLSGQGLVGTLPSFASLAIQSLDLSGNSFSGSIPDNFLSTIDAGSLNLDLSSNQLTGELPGSLSRFSLSSMNFADNKITGVSGK